MGDSETRYLKVANEADRITVASILFKNGYTVSNTRRKKNGKSYEYFVSYAQTTPDDMPGGATNEG